MCRRWGLAPRPIHFSLGSSCRGVSVLYILMYMHSHHSGLKEGEPVYLSQGSEIATQTH